MSFQFALNVIDFKRRRILIEDGKGAKDRMVYMSNDVLIALAAFLKVRPSSRSRRIFLVEKGPCKGQPIPIRGIQKRME
jgi:site-specific recombinase XerC